MEFLDHILSFSASTLRLSLPLVLAAMAGLICERSGVINIALEGFMLVGAFFAAAGAFWFGSGYLGGAVGVLAAAMIAALYGWLVITLSADQIVAGTGINLLAAGATPLLCKMFFASPTSSPVIDLALRLDWSPFFLAGLLVIGLHLWLKSTPSGLWLQFAGEHPQALECSGINVIKTRWLAVITSGAIAGLAGAVLAIGLSSGFSRGMTGGRGFMALAAMIFGRWRPIPATLACLFFGLTEALQIRMQGFSIGENGMTVPVQFIQMLPYIATILVLAGFAGKSLAPSALGQSAKVTNGR